MEQPAKSTMTSNNNIDTNNNNNNKINNIRTQKRDGHVKSADRAVLHMVASALEDGRVAARRRPHQHRQHRMIRHGGVGKGPMGAFRRRKHRRRPALVVHSKTVVRRRGNSSSRVEDGEEEEEKEKHDLAKTSRHWHSLKSISVLKVPQIRGLFY